MQSVPRENTDPLPLCPHSCRCRQILIYKPSWAPLTWEGLMSPVVGWSSSSELHSWIAEMFPLGKWKKTKSFAREKQGSGSVPAAGWVGICAKEDLSYHPAQLPVPDVSVGHGERGLWTLIQKTSWMGSCNSSLASSLTTWIIPQFLPCHLGWILSGQWPKHS